MSSKNKATKKIPKNSIKISSELISCQVECSDTISQEKNNKKSNTPIKIMGFINKWNIDLDLLPECKEFKHDRFYQLVDEKILTLLLADTRVTKEQKDQIRKSIDKINKNGNIAVTHIQKMKYKNFGRFYADKDSHSLIPLSRTIKHTVFKYLGYIDVDMICAHQSIALSIADLNNVDLSALKIYVNNREQIIKDEIEYYSVDGEERLSVDNLKYKFNILAYGGSEKTWRENIEAGDNDYSPKKIANKEPSDFTKKFIKDVNILTDLIYENNKELLDEIYVKDDNITEKGNLEKNKRSLVSCFFQIIENDILYTTYKFLKKHKVITDTNVSLEFDGLCIQNRLRCDDNKEILTMLNSHILKVTGLRYIKFKLKGYSDALDDIIKVRQNMSDEEEGVFNDLDACKKVFKLYPNWVYCCGELYVYDINTGLWSTDIVVINKIIKNHADKLYICDERGKVSKTKSYGNTVPLMKRIPEFMKTLCVNDNWLKEKQNSSLGKLLFNNGYYDLKKDIFYEKNEDGFDYPEIVFFGKIHNDYKKPYKEDLIYMEYIKKTLFYDPLGENVGNYLLLNISRGLAGDIMKRIIFGLGESNSGKSLLVKAICLACGDYANTFNAENLSHKNTFNDEAQMNRWALLLRYSRLLLSNELKSTVELNGNMIKKHSSGGDQLIGRVHGGLEIPFIPHYLLLIFANDLPPIKPYDDAINNRTSVANYKKAFVDNPTNEFELKKDDALEEKIKTVEFRTCLVYLFIKTYGGYIKGIIKDEIVDEVKDAKAVWISQKDNVISMFLEEHELTNDKNDFIKSNKLVDWLEYKKLGITMKKFAIELNKYCKLKKYDNIKNGDKFIDKKAHTVWYGIKENNE